MYEAQKKWAKEKRKKSPEFAKKQSELARKWQLANPVRNALNEYKKRARNKNIEFELSDDLFEHLIKSDCHYCNSKASPINGIDRIDSSVGYKVGNILPACKICNLAKNKMTYNEFINWIKTLLKTGRYI